MATIAKKKTSKAKTLKKTAKKVDAKAKRKPGRPAKV